jgi:hypothetical protein
MTPLDVLSMPHASTRGSAMISEDLRRTNASLHDRIQQVLELHPDLRDEAEAIALSQDLHVEVGAPFLERTRQTARTGEGDHRTAPGAGALFR